MADTCLPVTPELGHLTLSETYIYYDGPKLFLCENRLGVRYLSVWVGSNAQGEVWLLAPISLGRLGLVRAGQHASPGCFQPTGRTVCIQNHCCVRRFAATGGDG